MTVYQVSVEGDPYEHMTTRDPAVAAMNMVQLQRSLALQGGDASTVKVAFLVGDAGYRAVAARRLQAEVERAERALAAGYDKGLEALRGRPSASFTAVRA